MLRLNFGAASSRSNSAGGEGRLGGQDLRLVLVSGFQDVVGVRFRGEADVCELPHGVATRAQGVGDAGVSFPCNSRRIGGASYGFAKRVAIAATPRPQGNVLRAFMVRHRKPRRALPCGCRGLESARRPRNRPRGPKRERTPPTATVSSPIPRCRRGARGGVSLAAVGEPDDAGITV
jgi:hypothetical protein